MGKDKKEKRKRTKSLEKDEEIERIEDESEKESERQHPDDVVEDESSDEDVEEEYRKENEEKGEKGVKKDNRHDKDDDERVEENPVRNVVRRDAFSTGEPFDILELSPSISESIKAMGFTTMTPIQAKAIPPLLSGKDLIGSAKTGSGKTLAFLIPVVELLKKVKFKQRQGTGAIIITPTRELALQIYSVLDELCNKESITYGVCMGGANRKTEASKLVKGVGIIVCTPGRLLDHLQNTAGFEYSNLQCLVIDEADRILQIGFEEDMKSIIRLLPKNRQTMLFSATQDKKVEGLSKLALKSSPVYVGVDDSAQLATVNNLEQGFVVCESSKRFLLLYTFLKKNLKKKIMVFFSSCNSVKFHSELLNYIDIPVLDIHGKQKQSKRTSTFFEFCNLKSGILLCTDVAARGLDIPSVDWIIQFDPPDDPKEYIHRVGRTARGVEGSGKALLFLTAEELGFLKYLKNAKVALNEYEFPENKIAKVQNQLEKLIAKNFYLYKSAKEAYKSYIMAYASHSLKDIFNINNIDLSGVAKAFGFTTPPHVNLSVFKTTGPSVRDRNRKPSKRRKFNDANPYGDKSGEDRQFVY